MIVRSPEDCMAFPVGEHSCLAKPSVTGMALVSSQGLPIRCFLPTERVPRGARRGEMATEISAPGSQRAIGHEEFSLYSSLSEEELLQLAIEQSLADKARGPGAEAARQPAHCHPWTR